jgi:hypothetical protein
MDLKTFDFTMAENIFYFEPERLCHEYLSPPKYSVRPDALLYKTVGSVDSHFFDQIMRSFACLLALMIVQIA